MIISHVVKMLYIILPIILLANDDKPNLGYIEIGESGKYYKPGQLPPGCMSIICVYIIHSFIH